MDGAHSYEISPLWKNVNIQLQKNHKTRVKQLNKINRSISFHISQLNVKNHTM